ncbi:MAG: class I SAM-dependent DNA methyltransferase [Christensenellales bacterium]|jgi:ubiquinone/menaquinone biosynthesis C-methylase UbiE
MDSYGHFASVYDTLMDDVDYGKWAEYIEMLLSENGHNSRLRIAEAACGTGSISVKLGKRHEIIASDISPDMLERAAEKCRKAGLSVKLICQDMRKLKLHSGVEAVISCCDGVNYLRKKDDVLDFFTAARQALKPGGLLLFDISSEFKLSNTMNNAFFGEDRENIAYLWQNTYNTKTKIVQMDLSLFIKRPDGAFERHRETHLQRAYSEAEISDMLEECGFEVKAVYECFTTEAPLPRSPRIQFVAAAKEERRRYGKNKGIRG